MLRRLAAVVACVLLLALVPTGSLYVTTLPSGADVWLDGSYVGRSPLVLDAVATGRHTLSLTMAGWSSRQLDVTVVPGQTTLSSLRLERSSGGGERGGSIGLHGVAVLQAKIDGAIVVPGKDGTLAAAGGTHELTVRTRRGKLTRTVTVWPQTRTDVVLRDDVEEQVRPSVVAPADDYVPASAIHIVADRIEIRYNKHDVSGRLGSTTYRVDGRAVEYDSAPSMIGTRIYLPMELLTTLAGNR